jgi:signal transduction histidine kinase
MSDRIPVEGADGTQEIPEGEDLDLDLDVEEGADDDGGEPEGSDDGGAGEEEAEGDDVEPAPRRGGGAATPRNLRRRAQEAERALAAERAERTALDARLRQLEQRQAVDPQAAARAAAERAERRRLMAPDELVADVTQELRQEFTGAFQTLQFQQQDALDKADFRASTATSRVRQAYVERVEQALAAERAAGRNWNREAVFKFLYGDDMEKRASRAAPAQRRAAAARVAGQTTRPVGARGGAAPARRQPADSYEADRALIDGKPLW